MALTTCTYANNHKICGKPADYTFTWPWGEEGASCIGCAHSTRVLAQQLARDITLIPVTAAAKTSDELDLPRISPEQFRTLLASFDRLGAIASTVEDLAHRLDLHEERLSQQDPREAVQTLAAELATLRNAVASYAVVPGASPVLPAAKV